MAPQLIIQSESGEETRRVHYMQTSYDERIVGKTLWYNEAEYNITSVEGYGEDTVITCKQVLYD